MGLAIVAHAGQWEAVLLLSSVRLFPLMGTVFGFVHSDVATKIEQTRDLVESKEGQHYLTFKTMMEFETSNDLVHRKDPRSGSVLLLRLHRALEFIVEFLKEANEASDDASMSSMGRGSYEKTLSKHHGWIVRNTVKLAMLTLPQKKDLFRRITYEDDETMATLRAKGTEIIVSIHSIYERCQALYVKFDLHGIP
ncbi:unnamed protein product [Darwinula stevensoni]|uniref:Glycolipid transfer protein domain-containing protein n=1 Tax=Darwinula stevensoni TaxID=69355 RepID=A0A7R9FPI4_9CRUS|nr:unnamed protein product [Darwinula stevensoni]CAG0898058.1 unnamed protein product [Darwinula stevensoni]